MNTGGQKNFVMLSGSNCEQSRFYGQRNLNKEFYLFF